MPLNESRGNMYPFVTHTWNTVKGACSHDCAYCYMKRWGNQRAARFDERELKTDLSPGKIIFIGSGCDLFADDIPAGWITQTLDRANVFGNNRYLVQTKNPPRYHGFLDRLDPGRFMLCTTLETNRHYEKVMGKAPPTADRAAALRSLPRQYQNQKMITIEPVMAFDLKDFAEMILACRPVQVNIGSDSGGHGLPEPSLIEIEELTYLLEKEGIRVFQKKNLNRLLRGGL